MAFYNERPSDTRLHYSIGIVTKTTGQQQQKRKQRTNAIIHIGLMEAIVNLKI